jgi:hypothetical protein
MRAILRQARREEILLERETCCAACQGRAACFRPLQAAARRGADDSEVECRHASNCTIQLLPQGMGDALVVLSEKSCTGA